MDSRKSLQKLVTDVCYAQHACCPCEPKACREVIVTLPALVRKQERFTSRDVEMLDVEDEMKKGNDEEMCIDKQRDRMIARRISQLQRMMVMTPYQEDERRASSLLEIERKKMHKMDLQEAEAGPSPGPSPGPSGACSKHQDVPSFCPCIPKECQEALMALPALVRKLERITACGNPPVPLEKEGVDAEEAASVESPSVVPQVDLQYFDRFDAMVTNLEATLALYPDLVLVHRVLNDQLLDFGANFPSKYPEGRYMMTRSMYDNIMENEITVFQFAELAIDDIVKPKLSLFCATDPQYLADDCQQRAILPKELVSCFLDFCSSVAIALGDRSGDHYVHKGVKQILNVHFENARMAQYPYTAKELSAYVSRTMAKYSNDDVVTID